MAKHLVISRSVIGGILAYAKIQHPREGILLLRGSTDKTKIYVNEIVVPPLAIHGHSFSNFSPRMLPIDLSIVGTAHSHPSGVLQPSVGDLNNFYGIIMVIAAYPYNSEERIAVYNREGNAIEYETVSEK
ncbi:MAG: Mov34/MPN/PAD-1 family protein [Candidatus Atabeyarchaeum deiterrae]|jgi:proteasome lid subunit RPN8/RPN11